MSYTHTHLPDINTLKTFTDNQLKLFSKYDSFIGSTDSITFLKSKLKL